MCAFLSIGEDQCDSRCTQVFVPHGNRCLWFYIKCLQATGVLQDLSTSDGKYEPTQTGCLLQHPNPASCCCQSSPSPSGAGALDEKNALYNQQFWEEGNTTICWNPNCICLPSTDPNDLYNTP